MKKHLNNYIAEATENLSVVNTVRDFKKIKVNHNCVIYPDNDFVYLNENNRGGRIDRKKINNFKKIILENRYYAQLANISIDRNGMISEGTNKTIALFETGNPIVAKVCYPKTIEQISFFNSGFNTKWKVWETFMSTRNEGVEAALIADKKRDKVLKKYDLRQSQLSYAQLYGIAVEDVRFFSGGKNVPTMFDYKDPSFLRKVKSRRFNYSLDLFAKLTKLLERKGTGGKVNRGYKAIKEMMRLHFERSDWFYLKTAATLIEVRLNNSKNVPFTDDSIKAIRQDIKEMFGVH